MTSTQAQRHGGAWHVQEIATDLITKAKTSGVGKGVED